MGIATSRTPKIGVVIVNYQGLDDTLECLQSLSQMTYPYFETVVVDQASEKGICAVIRAAFPNVMVVESQENTGFAGGCNAGIRDSFSRGAEYFFLLNNDTIVAPDLLEKLVETAESNEQIGIVGPSMLYYDAPETIWSAGGVMGLRGESQMLAQGSKALDFSDVRDVDFVVGCGFLAKRVVWEQVGSLDERYFLYYEEADWCAQARKAGWRIVTEPRAQLWHKVSRSTGNDSALTLYYMRRNVLRYLSRHAGPIVVFAAILNTARLALVWTIQGKGRKAQLLFYAVADYLRGRMGRADHLNFRAFGSK